MTKKLHLKTSDEGKELMLEAGVIRVMVRSTTEAGDITLTASAKGYAPASLTATTVACPQQNGFYVDANGKAFEADWASALPVFLERGATPATPSYKQTLKGVAVKSVEAGSTTSEVANMYDDNEKTQWQSDGLLDNAWVKVTLEKPAAIRQISIRLLDFRKNSYPLEVTTADGTVVWTGYTPKGLGNVYLDIEKPVKSATYKIRMIGPATVKEAFGSMTELAAKKNVSTQASKSNKLSIIEIEFNE